MPFVFSIERLDALADMDGSPASWSLINISNQESIVAQMYSQVFQVSQTEIMILGGLPLKADADMRAALEKTLVSTFNTETFKVDQPEDESGQVTVNQRFVPFLFLSTSGVLVTQDLAVALVEKSKNGLILFEYKRGVNEAKPLIEEIPIEEVPRERDGRPDCAIF